MQDGQSELGSFKNVKDFYLASRREQLCFATLRMLSLSITHRLLENGGILPHEKVRRYGVLLQ
jgi:hypothetical protein